MQLSPWALRSESRGAEFAEDQTFGELLRGYLHDDLRVGGGADRGWSVAEDEVWLVVEPLGRPRRDQGWKIHVAATVGSAREVLSLSLPVLVERRQHFKVARSLRQLEMLNGVGCPEGLSGKFLTVYPEDDRGAVELAQCLDAATDGRDGPRILSDRPLRPGSLVHVRYGAFRARRAFTPYGLMQPMVARPDGSLEEDRRLGRFVPPPWADDPFANGQIRPDAGPISEARSGGERGAPRIGAYTVEAALKRSNRGGLYRARAASGAEVILKEARPHVATDRFGRDVRDRLRHEHEILGAVAHLARPGGGPAPRPIEVFTHGGHLFLARDYLAGTTLRTAVRRHVTGGLASPPSPQFLAIAAGLADLLRRFHDAGLVVGDFNPNNVILLSERDGISRCALVDLELAHDPTSDTPHFRGATPGYASPRQEAGLAPTFADDVYALGATLAFVATAADPFCWPDAGSGRTEREKLADRLTLGRAPAWATELIFDCLAPAPEDRPPLNAIAGAIETARTNTKIGLRPTRALGVPSERELLAAIDGVIDYLAAVRQTGGERRWPATAFGAATDPRCVAHGSSGIGLFLLGCHRAAPTERTVVLLDDAITAAETAPDVEGDLPTGLYYGEAGVAWFLAEAATTLDRPHLARRAVDVLSRLPTAGSSPDLMVGTAGLGLAAARLALMTGDRRLADRAREAARALGAAARPSPRGPVWPVPAHFAVDGQSKTYPGYAYGLAGIATALLAASAVSGDEPPAALAHEALDGLLAWRQEGGGRRWWPTSSHATAGSPCWLKGTSGIGAGLARAYRLTGDPRYGEAALECWRLLRPASRHGPLTQLNGLAGIGEFFLDVADLLGEEGARGDAWDVARTIYAARIDRRAAGVGLCFPGEDGMAGADLMTGTTGVAAFLLRLVRPGPRLLTLDDLLDGETARGRGGETAGLGRPR